MTIKHRTRIGAVFGPVINWRDGLDFEVQYRTVVQQYRDGIEERESIRVNPRLRMEFTAHFMDEDAEDFIAEFSRNYDSVWYFGLPFRTTTVTQAISDLGEQDLARLQFEGALPFWAVVGASFIVQTDSVRELVHVVSVDAVLFQVVLSAPMTTTLLGAATAVSAVPIEFEGDTALKMLTSNLYEFKASISSVVGDEVFPIKTYTPLATLSGQPIHFLRPNWRDGIDTPLNPALRQVDFGLGRKYQKALYDFVTTTKKMTYMFTSADNMESYLSFIHYLKGQRKPFWYPDWGALLDRVPGSPASNTRFYTSNKYLGRNYSGSKTHRNIFIRFNDGTWYGRQITDFNVVNVPNYLGFATVTQNITDASLYGATWLTLNRLATDDVVFQFKTSVIGEVELSLKMLPTREVQST